MADITPTKLGSSSNADVWEIAMDATDKTIALFGLDPTKETTIAVATTGSATVQVDLYLENIGNSGPTGFTYASAAATSGGEDWVKSALGPIAGIDLTGTVTGGDTATIQILQSQKQTS